MNITLSPAKKIEGTLRVPGDKSISHRALIFGAIAEGETEIAHLLQGADVMSTKSCLEAMGIRFRQEGTKTIVQGKGLHGFRKPTATLDCGNSGTTMRLLMGLLSGQEFSAAMTGDQSLCKRPMKRVADPLRKMGAQFEMRHGDFAPLTVHGRKLTGIDYELPIASAQVKSAILLAGLYASGHTTVRGKTSSRDHTEKFLPYFGVPIEVAKDGAVTIQGGSRLRGAQVTVPGDPSSAAFWLGAACMIEGARIRIENVLLNPTRTGFIAVLQRMGARIRTETLSNAPEPVGTIEIEYAPLKGTTVTPDEIPSLIDEIPLLAVLATRASGTTTVRGAEELRVKESDRIEAFARNLRAMGAEIETHPDGFTLQGLQPLRGARIETYDDHRIAMAFSIASLAATGATEILNAECVSISYPDFFGTLRGIRRD